MTTKILYGINQLQIGGAERQLFELAKNIQDLGFDPQVFSLSAGGEFSNLLNMSGVPVITTERRLKVDIRPIRQIVNLIKEHRFNIIHLFGFYGGLYGRIAALRYANLKVIYSIRSTRINSLRSTSNPVYFFIDRILSTKTDIITANALSVKDFAINEIGLPESKIRVIYNGIGTEWFEKTTTAEEAQCFVKLKHGLPENSFLVGNVARLDPEKDHITYLKAAKKICELNNNVYFFIVGDGHLYEYLKKFTEKIGIQDKVIFSGKIIGDELKKYYDSFQIFVSSSRSEGLSNSILEAMARGKTVIATRVSETPEIIQDGTNGLLTPVGDDEALASKIMTLMNNHNLSMKLGIEGRIFVDAQFSVKKMVNQYNELYKDILENF